MKSNSEDNFKLSTNVTQFTIRHMLNCMALTAGAGVVYAINPLAGRGMFMGLCILAAGWTILFVSDYMDSRPIDDRVWWNQAMNTIGVIAFAIGALVYAIAPVILLAYKLSTLYRSMTD